LADQQLSEQAKARAEFIACPTELSLLIPAYSPYFAFPILAVICLGVMVRIFS
jgi:hypothetical protein